MLRQRTFWLGTATVLPLLVWWAGFYPGFLSSDSIDQLGQVDRFEFHNHHPAIHSLLMWLLGGEPGRVTFVQVIALAALLGVVAVRLENLGVHRLLSLAGVWAVALAPAVGATTVAVWKDVPFTLGLVWVFSELLAATAAPGAYWSSRAPIRLGLALAVVWLFRHNGFLTAIGLLLLLMVTLRQRRIVTVTLTTLAVGLAFNSILLRITPVNLESIEPSQVFISDVAAAWVDEPGAFSADERDLLASIAPLEVWTDAYQCSNSTPLAFHPRFDANVIKENPSAFRSLVTTVVTRQPGAVLTHRACAASYLFVPAQPAGQYLQRPPFEVPPNTLGIGRDPLSDRAFRISRAVFVWAEDPGRLWLTWRPAMANLMALATGIVLVVRRRFRPLLPLGVWAVHLINVTVTTPAHEFRYAFGLFIIGILSPLLLAIPPPQAHQEGMP